ncbi:MAG: hypothetical protein V7673_08895 [Paracoccus sp. (in: a-proteobacteria)]|uniref:hypothetical protein n=1 Tax=Paracoccus sp. TaxID=267 RepID=UPI0030016015
MPDVNKRTFRSITPKRIVALGGAAAMVIGTPLMAQAERIEGRSSYVIAQAEGEGEGGAAEAPVNAEGEGEASAAEGEGKGAEGEGEGGSVAAEGEGEAAASEGEGEAAASEGEGEAAASEGEGGGEGEGEGGGAAIDPDVAFLTDLGFMEGHLRAGLALYEAGDLSAAKTHMGHPIEEKYEAVAKRLDQLGYGDLREQISALAAAAEAEDSYEKIAEMFGKVRQTHEEVRTNFDAADQLKSFAALTRVAADEYAIAVEGGTLANVKEYHDAWGFMRVIQAEAGELAASDDASTSDAAAAIVEQAEAAGSAFGDLQGQGDYEKDPSILYAAAARMELASLGAE